MTPPEWLLQLLGGAAVVVLFLLVRVMWASRSAPTEKSHAPERTARLKQQQQNRAAHTRQVMRPGLIHAAFDRDFTSRSDMETHGWGWQLMMFEHDLPISSVLSTHIRASLPVVQNTRAAWLIQLHEQLEEPVRPSGSSGVQEGRQRVTDIAVMALEWDAPRLLCPDFLISTVGNNVLYAHYHVQEDPEKLYETHLHHVSPRVEMTRRSYSYDPTAVDPVRRTMVGSCPTLGDSRR